MYSAASMPTDDTLRFDIQLHYHGQASRYIRDTLKVGNNLKLRGPLGAAFLRRNCPAPILCISNNTGLGPLIALLRTISEARMPNPIYIYAGFSSAEYIYGRQELQQATKDLVNLRYSHTVVGGGALNRTDRLGLLTDVLTADFQDLSAYRVYAFGSPHAIEVSCRLLRLKGVAPNRLHAEPFVYSAF
ncbi:hypothetical protein [Pinisolibacter sp.]|uniref:hypothetical protein n=1 Tax=Pinisolibacter sp. TaxID=2172024 RepID=UPI002FDE8C76